MSHDAGLARHVDRVVSIRDGKTSTETIRQTVVTTTDGLEAEHEQFEELVVLDNAGRLQIPPLLRDQFNIGARVRLQPLEEGILIQAVAGFAAPGSASEKSKAPKKGPAKGWRRLLNFGR